MRKFSRWKQGGGGEMTRSVGLYCEFSMETKVKRIWQQCQHREQGLEMQYSKIFTPCVKQPNVDKHTDEPHSTGDWAFDAVIKMTLKMSPCKWSTRVRVLMLLPAQLLITCIFWGRNWQLRHLGPCHPHRRSGRTWLLSGPGPTVVGIWGEKQQVQDFISVSLHIPFPIYQINENPN